MLSVVHQLFPASTLILRPEGLENFLGPHLGKKSASATKNSVKLIRQ